MRDELDAAIATATRWERRAHEQEVCAREWERDYRLMKHDYGTVRAQRDALRAAIDAARSLCDLASGDDTDARLTVYGFAALVRAASGATTTQGDEREQR